MKTSQTSKPQQGQKKPQTLILSKKNLLDLIENKKMKTSRTYIEELRNSNPKAQKIVREVLEQVFIQKKVTSASVYMYALVFYKNLLVSGELDYYEDNQFFPHEIHDTIAKICEYNPKQANIKSKGVNYFKSCVKVQATGQIKQDLEAMGVAVIIYAMELLQSMAEWYKEDYFTGEQSRFLKAYNSCLKKGIVFPKKSEYVYIKEQDKTEFEQNFQELFEENQQQVPKPQAQKSKNQKPVQTKKLQKQQEDSKLLQFGELKSKVVKLNPQNQPQKKSEPIAINAKQPQIKNPKQNLNEPKTLLTTNQSTKKPAPVTNQAQSLLSKVQQKKGIAQDKVSTKIQSHNVDDLLKKIQLSQVSTGKKTEIQQKEKSQDKTQSRPQQKPQQKKLNNNQSFDFPQQLNETSKILPKAAISSKEPLAQNNKQTQSDTNKNLTSKPKDKKDDLALKNLPQSRVILQSRSQSQQMTSRLKKQPQEIKISEKSAEKKQNSNIFVNPSPKRNIKRTQEAIHKGTEFSFPPQPQNTQTNYFYKNDSKFHPRTSIIEKRKHKIFQQVPQRTSSAFKQSVEKPSLQVNQHSFLNQPSDGIKINILNSNVSFSQNYLTDKKYDSVKQSPIQRKKSAPKTQKKYLEKTFGQNEDLLIKFGLTQNYFNIGQHKTSAQKFPMKTLSAWRCEKQIKRDHSPQNKLNYQSLMQILKKLKFKELVLPFVPEYFEPVTLKMVGLRKSALQLTGFAQTSQVFFNNKIIQARLMKPAKNSYILSILNVSRLGMQISPADMRKVPHSSKIKIVHHGNSQDSMTVLNSGCYMDIHFSFQTSDLNFKFLPFNLLIDQSILPLQLPITLLDQCQVQRGIDVNNILSYSKKCVKIINSDPFRTNFNEIPKFIKKKLEVTERSKRGTSRDEQDYFSFSLRMKVGEGQSYSLLSCCVSPQNRNMNTWRLEIIFDSGSQETQAFAKVMVELLTFLLWQ